MSETIARAQIIEDRVTVDVNGCWIWSGVFNRHTGYGIHFLNGKHHLAHRLSFEIFKGPIADGLTIDHLCFVHACVNPDHLEAVTGFENTWRYIRAFHPTWKPKPTKQDRLSKIAAKYERLGAVRTSAFAYPYAEVN